MTMLKEYVSCQAVLERLCVARLFLMLSYIRDAVGAHDLHAVEIDWPGRSPPGKPLDFHINGCLDEKQIPVG